MHKILVVEDDMMNREMIAQRLTWEGYEVIMAEDGAHGVARAITERPDLVLMDMGLPILDGWQATRRLKSMSSTHAIPIIALTAFALSDDRKKCFRVGCDEYETKPVDFPRLLSKMQRLLQPVVLK
jgi:CheY-like chemotaxis protein